MSSAGPGAVTAFPLTGPYRDIPAHSRDNPGLESLTHLYSVRDPEQIYLLSLSFPMCKMGSPYPAEPWHQWFGAR